MSTEAPVVAFVVAKGKSRLDEWAVSVVDGAVVPLDAVPDAPDVVLTIAPTDADAVSSGALDVSVGFMRGQIKVAGDNAALLRALPALRGYTR